MLIVLSGLPATGKTALAAAVARELGAVLLSVDPVDFGPRLGRRPTRPAPAGRAAYAVVGAMAEQNLALETTVVVDAVNAVGEAKTFWIELARRRGVPPPRRRDDPVRSAICTASAWRAASATWRSPSRPGKRSSCAATNGSPGRSRRSSSTRSSRWSSTSPGSSRRSGRSSPSEPAGDRDAAVGDAARRGQQNARRNSGSVASASNASTGAVAFDLVAPSGKTYCRSGRGAWLGTCPRVSRIVGQFRGGYPPPVHARPAWRVSGGAIGRLRALLERPDLAAAAAPAARGRSSGERILARRTATSRRRSARSGPA